MKNPGILPSQDLPYLNSNFNPLEDFSPLFLSDPFHWIPKGLFYDLWDSDNDDIRSPRRVPLNDLVSDFSVSQFFNSLDPDINDLPNYRVRLLNENGNSQAVDVNSIFQFYEF